MINSWVLLMIELDSYKGGKWIVQPNHNPDHSKLTHQETLIYL